MLIGKVYFGFIDEEFKKLDNWVWCNVVGCFGFVWEVKKDLVLEVVFDVVYFFLRYKLGVVLCFFCIYCICWDKFVVEVDMLINVKVLIEN